VQQKKKINFNQIHYRCRVKWGFTKTETRRLTLKQYVAFMECENEEKNPPEQLAFADDVL